MTASNGTSGNNNTRPISAGNPGNQVGTYVQRLIRLGVPSDVAMRIGLGYVKRQNGRNMIAMPTNAPALMQAGATAPASQLSAAFAMPGGATPATAVSQGALPQTPSFSLPVLSHPTQAQFLRTGQPFFTPDGRLKRAV
jgi:hypothetical protein